MWRAANEVDVTISILKKKVSKMDAYSWLETKMTKYLKEKLNFFFYN